MSVVRHVVIDVNMAAVRADDIHVPVVVHGVSAAVWMMRMASVIAPRPGGRGHRSHSEDRHRGYDQQSNAFHR